MDEPKVMINGSDALQLASIMKTLDDQHAGKGFDRLLTVLVVATAKLTQHQIDLCAAQSDEQIDKDLGSEEQE